jgi:soluble lytic murein transglycosylase-like protein
MQEIITIISMLAITLTGLPSTETYTAEVEVPLSVKEMVTIYADEFGVDQELAHHIAFGESGYNPNAIGDMNITCPSTGLPVRARGVMQLTECWYGHVSDEEAFDAETNIKVELHAFRNSQHVATTINSAII